MGILMGRGCKNFAPQPHEGDRPAGNIRAPCPRLAQVTVAQEAHVTGELRTHAIGGSWVRAAGHIALNGRGEMSSTNEELSQARRLIRTRVGECAPECPLAEQAWSAPNAAG